MQNAHRRACSGIFDMQSGHARVAAAGSGSVRDRAMSLLPGRTIAKYTAAAFSRNGITALRKSPYRWVLWLTVKLSAEKSGWPPMGGDQRGEEVPDQRRDDGTKGGPDDHRDRQVDDVG